MAAKGRAVVLVSGGLDSCVTSAIAARDYELALLHVGYGQRTQKRELQAFQAIADFFGVSNRLVTSLEHLAQIGGSSLTDAGMAVRDADLSSHEIPTSYVPFRNAHLLAIATSWAEVLGAVRIFIGVVEEDASGYPDCRQTFIDAFNRVIEAGTKPGSEIRVETPLIGARKEEIVAMGTRLGAPLDLTWSCYKAEDKACGVCDSCAFRLRGFFRAGVRDPIEYVSGGIRARYQ